MSFMKENIVDIDLSKGNIHRSYLNHAIGMNDDDADWFGVRVFRDGEPVLLEGGSVQGFFKQPGRDPIAITSGNNISGNLAEVLLPQACYNYEGQFTLAIKLINTSEGVTGTMRIVDGVVDNTNVNGAVAPTGTIPTYQEVLAVYDQMVAAKEGSVRFDITQQLTSAQKTRARDNVEAASQGDVSDLKSALNFDEYLINAGQYTIKATDLESGQWSFSTKATNEARARTKFLIPVRAGMVITYSNTTFDTYFNVLETPTSQSYITNIGWKTDGNGIIPITVDGYLAFIIRNHSDTSATVNPSDYNSTVVFTTKMESDSYINKYVFSSGNIADITENSVYQIRFDDIENIQGLPESVACTVITNRYTKTDNAYLTQIVITYADGHVYYRHKYNSWNPWVRLSDFNNHGTYTGDLNNITDNVVRTVASGGTRPTNFPSAFGNDAAIIITVQLIPNNPNFLVQTCISYTSGRILTRYRNNTTWSAWNIPISLDNTMVVKGTLSSSGNADNITDNSVYGVQASNSYPSNYPMKTSPGILLTSKPYNVNGYGLQVAFPYDHDVMTDPYRYQNGLYARRLYNSTWQDWSFYKLTPRNHAGKYFAFGDSTTWGYSADRDHIQSPWNYPAIVGDLIGCEVHNLADPAQGLIKDWTSPATSGNFPIVDTIAEMVENGDFDGTTLVTVGWAYNDGSKYGDLNFGSPTDPIPSSNTGITTFIGYYARILAVLQEAAPGAMVMLVTGYGTPWDNEGHKGDILFSYKYTFADGQKSTKEMYDALEQMANYYGFYCVNQAKGGVINRVSANYIIGDNIHPTYDKYRIYGNFVASRIVSAFQNV